MRHVSEHEVHTAGTITTFSAGSTLDVDGAASFAQDPTIPDEAYGVGWNGVLEPPTKNAVYDKVETLQPLDADLTALAAINGVQGDIIYRDASAWVRLPKGTAGQTLKMNAGATAPEWV